MCNNGRENRRIVLQMSVWQEFLIGLAHIYPADQDEFEITSLVFKAFKILLHHAIKFEYGGWRVWIDTLSILHSRVAREDYQLKMNKMYEEYEQGKELVSNQNSNDHQDSQEKGNLTFYFKVLKFISNFLKKTRINI